MAVTRPIHAGNPDESGQIERLVANHILHGSESLCKLLRYLAARAIEQPGVPVKEYQIATEVFGRSGDFDPRLDSTVRVQTGRLRSKLAEYYASEGSGDPVIVDIPKGAYLISFIHRDQHRDQNREQLAATGPEHHWETSAKAEPKGGAGDRGVAPVWRLAALVLAGAVIASITVIAVLASGRPRHEMAQAVSPVFRSFWKLFLESPEEPWVIYSNAAFVGRPETGLRYFNPKTDSKDKILDHYTGVGEVLAIHELDRVFALLHRAIRVKRGRLLSLDDAKNNNLIFVGSPSENLTLREIPGTRDFLFRTLPDGPRKGDLAIFNVRPRPGEEPYYIAAPDLPITDDYALIGLVPGINPSHWVMLLAGTTTIGTQAVVEYVCHTNTVEDLMHRLGRAAASVPFEAVLHVTVTRGVPVESSLVAVHETE